MKRLHDNVYVPDNGYRYLTNGDVFATEIVLGSGQSIESWYNTNEEPQNEEIETELTAEETLDIIVRGCK